MASKSGRQIAGNQRRTLRAMRVRLLTMAAAWDEIDQFNVGELTSLADEVEKVACSLDADDYGELKA